MALSPVPQELAIGLALAMEIQYPLLVPLGFSPATGFQAARFDAYGWMLRSAGC